MLPPNQFWPVAGKIILPPNQVYSGPQSWWFIFVGRKGISASKRVLASLGSSYHRKDHSASKPVLTSSFCLQTSSGASPRSVRTTWKDDSAFKPFLTSCTSWEKVYLHWNQFWPVWWFVPLRTDHSALTSPSGLFQLGKTILPPTQFWPVQGRTTRIGTRCHQSCMSVKNGGACYAEEKEKPNKNKQTKKPKRRRRRRTSKEKEDSTEWNAIVAGKWL